MAEIKIRVELNKGKKGIPLGKLASIASGFQSFLSAFAGDVGLNDNPENWIASNFKNGSVAYDIRYTEEVTEEKKDECKSKLRVVASGNKAALKKSGLNPETVNKVADIVAPTEPHEVVRIGLYQDGNKRKKWFEISRENVPHMPELPSDAEGIEYYGSVQGEIVSWFMKPSKPNEKPWFWLRDSSTGAQIKCVYPSYLHHQVNKLTESYDGVIHVYGQITASVGEDKIEYIEVDTLEIAEKFTDDDFEKFFGCAPNLTGGLTAAEYVRRLRGNGEQI